MTIIIFDLLGMGYYYMQGRGSWFLFFSGMVFWILITWIIKHGKLLLGVEECQ